MDERATIRLFIGGCVCVYIRHDMRVRVESGECEEAKKEEVMTSAFLLWR